MNLQTIKQLRLQKLIIKKYLKILEELSLNKGGSFGLFLKKGEKYDFKN